MSDTIFESTQEAPAAPEATQLQQDEGYDKFLTSIVGNDGNQKYKDVPTALSALKHSQEHIKKLEAELEALRSSKQESVTLENVLEAITTTKEPEVQPAPAGLSPDDVLNLLAKHEQAKAEKENINRVANKFKEVFGEKAEEEFYSRSASLGLSKEQVHKLASQSPNAVFNMLGVQSTPTTTPSLKGSVNTAAMVDTPVKGPENTIMGYTRSSDVVDHFKQIEKQVYARLGLA